MRWSNLYLHRSNIFIEGILYPTVLAYIVLQKFANWNSFPTYSALLRTESSIFVSVFFCDVFLVTFTLYVQFIVLYSKIVLYVFFILYCTTLEVVFFILSCTTCWFWFVCSLSVFFSALTQILRALAAPAQLVPATASHHRPPLKSQWWRSRPAPANAGPYYIVLH